MKFLLVLILGNPSTSTHHIGGVFADQDSCLKSLKETAIVVPEHNAENEWGGAKTCIPFDGALATWSTLKVPLVGP